jgi:hypothetical protein
MAVWSAALHPVRVLRAGHKHQYPVLREDLDFQGAVEHRRFRLIVFTRGVAPWPFG